MGSVRGLRRTERSIEAMALKLLIAEDEDMIRNGMEKYIRLHTDRFEKIYLARDGQEALDQIFQYRPDVMLLDVQMPVKDGIEVLQEAKRMNVMPLTVILSGFDEFKYAQQALKYGVREYMLKPSRSSDILQCLYKLADEIEGTAGKNRQEDGAHYAVDQAKKFIEEHYNEELTLQQAAEYAGISPGYLSTLFHQQLDCGFVEYLNQFRVERACTYLQQSYFKTYEIAYKVGFRDEKYFSKVFKRIKGKSPSEYRKTGKEE